MIKTPISNIMLFYFLDYLIGGYVVSMILLTIGFGVFTRDFAEHVYNNSGLVAFKGIKYVGNSVFEFDPLWSYIEKNKILTF